MQDLRGLLDRQELLSGSGTRQLAALVPGRRALRAYEQPQVAADPDITGTSLALTLSR